MYQYLSPACFICSSTIVGLPGTKRNKFTVFDFLTIPAGAEPPPPPPDVTLASVAATKQQKTKKPGREL